MRLLFRTAPFAPAPIVWVLREPGAELRRVAGEPRDALRGLGVTIRFGRPRVFGAMAREHRRRRRFEFLRLAGKVGARATPVLRRVARQFHAIDREHLAADEALLVAHREHRGEHPRDVVTQRAHELRDRREVRRPRAAERDEGHVLFAGPRDATTAHDALRVGEQHDLEQQRRRIGRRAGRVVPKPRVEMRQIDGVVEQMVQGVLEGAREQLAGEVHRQELGVGVDVLVTGHAGLDGEGSTAQIRGTELSKAPARIRRGAGLFLQPR